MSSGRAGPGHETHPYLQWQHRTCQSDVNVEDYRSALNTKQTIDWQCNHCLSFENAFSNQLLNSTPVYLDGRVPEYMDIISEYMDIIFIYVLRLRNRSVIV